MYQEPIKSGECRVSDTKKLWSHIEPHLKKCLSTVHLREVASKQLLSLEQEQSVRDKFANSIQSLFSIGSNISNPNKLNIELELLFYSKFLIIVASRQTEADCGEYQGHGETQLSADQAQALPSGEAAGHLLQHRGGGGQPHGHH